VTTSVYIAFALILSVLLLVKSGVTSVSLGVLVAFLLLAAIPWYFGTRDRSSPSSRLERVLATMWVWFRRILGVSMGILIFAGGLYALSSEAGAQGLPNRWIAGGLLILVGIFLIYFGIFGQGHRRYDWRDDIALHKENKRRYRWRL